MPRVLLCNLLDGRRLVDLPYVTYRWEQRKNQPETLEVVTTLTDPDVQALGLANAATPGKTVLAIVEDGLGGEWFAGAGPMDEPDYDMDAQQLTLPANGILSFYDDRNVLPSSAYSIDTTQFVIPDPSDATKTIPNPSLTTTLNSWSFATIIKKLIQQAQTWPASTIPIVFPADVAGVHVRDSYYGVNLKSVKSAVDDVTNVLGGPELQLPGRYQSDRKGVEWVLLAGTDDKPKLSSGTTFRWIYDARPDGAMESSVRGVKLGADASTLASVSWASGGRSSDTALVERATSTYLTDAGFPLREVTDTTHTDVSVRSTLQGYAQDNLAAAQAATPQAQFQVLKDVAPYLGTYNIGDTVELAVLGDPYYGDVEITGRISVLAGDDGDWVTITLESD